MFINDIHNQNSNNIKTIDLFETNFLNKKNKEEENKSFMHYLAKALDTISSADNNAKSNAEKLTLNESGVSLNDVIIDLEKSSISIQMAIQIKNKIVSAYQEIMNQQI